MAFANALTCIVSLLKKDGSFFEEIHANVEEDQIVVLRSDITIGKGDLVRRETTQGQGDVYRIDDPMFVEAFSTVEAHYQLEVMKLAPVEAKSAIAKITGTSNWPALTPPPPPPEPEPKPLPAPPKRAAKKTTRKPAAKAPAKKVKAEDVELPGEIPLKPVAKKAKPASKTTKASAPKEDKVLAFPEDIAKELLDFDGLEEPLPPKSDTVAEKPPAAEKVAPSKEFSLELLDRELEEEEEKQRAEARKKAPHPPKGEKPAAKKDTKSAKTKKVAAAKPEPVKSKAVSAKEKKPESVKAKPEPVEKEDKTLEVLDKVLKEEESKVIPKPVERQANLKPVPAPPRKAATKPTPVKKQVVEAIREKPAKKTVEPTRKVVEVKPTPKAPAPTPQQQVEEHLAAIRAEIQRLVKDEKEKADALELVNAIEAQIGSGTPSKAVVGTLLKALPDHTSISVLASFVVGGLS